MRVEALRHVPGDLDMLALVTAHRDGFRAVGQDVRGHQHRIAEQARADALVGRPAVRLVVRHGRLVGMRPVEQPLRGGTAENPGQLAQLGQVRLAVQDVPLGIQAEGDESGGHVQDKLADLFGPRRRRQRVIVGHEEQRVPRAGQLEGGLDHAEVVAQVRPAGGLDAGDGSRHGTLLSTKRPWPARPQKKPPGTAGG